jgi:hypothetical protein
MLVAVVEAAVDLQGVLQVVVALLVLVEVVRVQLHN